MNNVRAEIVMLDKKIAKVLCVVINDIVIIIIITNQMKKFSSL
jgi:hypothetical protein